MLLITGTASCIGLLLLLLFVSEEPIDYPQKYLLDDIYTQAPIVHECNYEFSPASYLKRKKEKERRNTTRFSISNSRSEYFIARHLQHEETRKDRFSDYSYFQH